MSYRYETIPTTKVDNVGEQYIQTNVYPDIPVVQNDNYVITTVGDRLDLLALDFYGDMTLWWVIASANNLPGDSIYPPIGAQLRIPANAPAAINQYKQENYTR
jgi:nucleoid-associated protein YgaU